MEDLRPLLVEPREGRCRGEGSESSSGSEVGSPLSDSSSSLNKVRQTVFFAGGKASVFTPLS